MKLYNSKEYLIEQLKTRNYLQIARENNISRSTIQRKLRQFGFTEPRISWTQKEIKLLKGHYGIIKNVHSLFPDRTQSAIYHKTNKLGLKSSLRKRYRHVNEDFFKKLDKGACYLLGWLFSDGNVAKNKRSFGFHLSKKDTNVLKKFKKLLNSNHKISFHGNYAQFRVCSKRMCEDLIALGCIPRKTKKIIFPRIIPDKYLKDFVRGYFEGDGGIYFSYKNTIRVSINGNKQFIDGLRKKVSEILQIEIPKLRQRKGAWTIQFYGDNARKFCRWIYDNCGDLFLERKFLAYRRHLQKLK